ncbi:MAG: hypothetical protein WA374_01740 [Acidobacteriaceae bacterium]
MGRRGHATPAGRSLPSGSGIHQFRTFNNRSSDRHLQSLQLPDHGAIVLLAFAFAAGRFDRAQDTPQAVEQSQQAADNRGG